MVISQANPSPDIESASVEFPIADYYGAGTYTFVIRRETLQEPRLITTSCYKEPLFAIKADLNISTGELWVAVGPADSRVPQSLGFLLPRYLREVSEHSFKVSFRDWQIAGASMDDTPLQLAPIPTEIILIHHGIEQLVSVCDLLRPHGTFCLKISGDIRALGRIPLFQLQSQIYDFQLLLEDQDVVLKRCGMEVRAPLIQCEDWALWIIWSPTMLQLMEPEAQGQTIWSVTTPTVMPPRSLLRLARAKKLQPSSSFASIEAFRTAVHEALCNLVDDVAESGAYSGFWDQRYQGKRKSKPLPKKETDIHRQILLPLYDWAKMRSVEIIPENETAVGKLDICLIGSVEGQGPVPFCIEVKLAHAQDLEHGLETQLPEYMATKRARYGAYVVVWFKGEWFSRPSANTIRNLWRRVLPGYAQPVSPHADELGAALTTKVLLDPRLHDIRVFVLDVTKSDSASKKE